MKRTLSIAIMLLLSTTALLYNGCGLEDLTNPVITLNGDAVVYVQHGGSWTDPGFTATDDKDGDLTASVIVTGTVDATKAKTYTLTYTVMDAAGNQGTTERKVIVRHTKNSVAGTYSTTESCTISGNFGPYSCSITPRTGNEFTITMNNFGDFPTTVDLQGELTGENGQNLTILQQVVTGITFTGSGTVNEGGTQIVITYTADDGVDSETCTATWTKQ